MNKVMLFGNLGADPDSRSTGSGTAVTNLRLATSYRYKNKQTGELEEKTEWHSVVCWARTAEIAAEYLRKGSQVLIEGRLETRKWQDNEGRDRYSTEVHCEHLSLVGGGGRQGGSQQGSSTRSGGPAPTPPPADDFSDDIPF